MGKGGEELSPFFASIFPLFPQKRLILRLRTPVHVSLRNAINLPGTGNIFFCLRKMGNGLLVFWSLGGRGRWVTTIMNLYNARTKIIVVINFYAVDIIYIGMSPRVGWNRKGLETIYDLCLRPAMFFSSSSDFAYLWGPAMFFSSSSDFTYLWDRVLSPEAALVKMVAAIFLL